MAPIKVGINGFGRIGRIIMRHAINDPLIQFVGINDVFDVAAMAHLLKYDSIFGRAQVSIETKGDSLVINGKSIPISKETDPTKLPWKTLGAQVVLECTGKFTDKEKAAAHLTAGAKKVIVSAPAKGDDLTVVMGVNHQAYDPAKHTVISNASCTTNCLAPVAKVLHETFGIERGFMTTIHSYTNDQRLMDGPHKDLRRARAGAMSQIPTTTGAAKAVGLVLPELKGKLDGFSVRVPTPDVSCVDLVCVCKKAATVDSINASLKKAAEGNLKGIMAYSDEPLVSVDYLGNTHSAIIDAECTKVIDNLVKVLAWYDNETGFSARMIDLAKYVGERL
ncbi:MAG: type I glyceraldehyde-3-phosphate dehydrogenase [Deltaproteobacteria bacterium]|nr:type I glyceraldehyde-3-phosphate dehydrogenase [Deltaproteobacteria bacterium]